MKARRALVVGEVLFDQFPDGKSVLGGAPFNVAWNLQGLGLAPLFISAVGADERGGFVREKMAAWGMDTSELQTSRLPTGTVRVELRSGEPTFHILDQQAYDEIRYPSIDSFSDFRLLYFGSLAFRNETTRSTIRQLLGESGLPRFVDINIRRPWFDEDWIAELLSGAAWTKLNDHELSLIAGTECGTAGEIAAAVETLRRRYGGQQYLITCGAAGAYGVDEDRDLVFAEATPPDVLVDPVGAGDAFAAATILGITDRAPLDDVLRVAVRFASHTCSIQGATTQDRAHYLSWQDQK